MKKFTRREILILRWTREYMQATGWKGGVGRCSRYICDNVNHVLIERGHDNYGQIYFDLTAKISERLDEMFSVEEWLIRNVDQARIMHDTNNSQWLEQVWEYRLRWLSAMIQGQA